MNLDNNANGSDAQGEDFLVLIIVIVLVIGIWYNFHHKPNNEKELFQIEKTLSKDSLHSVEVNY